ncbi:MAG: hypothetical protein ABEJ23_04585 [Haloarculaceae archaeon]
MPWVCERCGHRRDGNDPPCPQCGYEDLAQVRTERVPDRLSPAALFVWRCPDCGRTHGRRRARCASCDRTGLVAAYVDDGEVSDGIERPSNGGPSSGRALLDQTVTSTAWLVAFAVGLFTVIAGVLFLVGGSPTFGAPLVLAGLFALPSVRERIARIVGARPPGWLAAIGYVLGLIAAVAWYNA